jgi:outer membrane protein assembly factor BamA
MTRATFLDVAARAGLLGVFAGAAGCASVPPGCSAIDSVRIVGMQQIDSSNVTDKLATTASPKFLGLFRGVVYDYAVFDASALQRDLARVERYYRGQGFLEAHARTARVIPVSADHVRVEIVVDEGAPTRNRRVQVDGLDELPAPIAEGARQTVTAALPEGARFDEDVYANVQTALTRALTDRGYAYAKVEADAQADLVAHAIDYRFTVRAGPATVFSDVTIVGLNPQGSGARASGIEEAPLRRAMHIRPGTPYSTTRIESATQALLDLRVLRSAQVVPQLPEPPATVVPLTVQVEPTKLRSVRLGGGVELDEIKAEVHALAGWEDLNFFGGLRDFSAELKPGVVLYPTRISNLSAPNQLLPEERLRVQFRQHGFLEARTSLFVQPEVNLYPLLVEANPDPKANVVGYLEPKGAVGVDRRFGRHFFANLSHNVQSEIPFSYKGRLDPFLPNILLSFPQLITTFDFRDHPVQPHSGVYLSNSLQAAGVGGNAQDVRVQPDLRVYLPIAKGVTLAARSSVGFLFAFNYGDYVHNHLADPQPANTLAANSDIEIAYFRGFFSGGPGSNRGFPVRGIAPHGFVPFLNPATATTQTSLNCGPANPSRDPSCSIPIGGFTLWEASVELRLDVSGPFGVTAFCDSGDVSAREADVRLSHVHLSCGAGMRYGTPVGPIRLDVGYRIQPLQVLGYATETAAVAADPTEGTQPNIFYVPLAVAFGIGEAF